VCSATSLKEPSINLGFKVQVLFPAARVPSAAAWMPVAGMLPHAAFCLVMPKTTGGAGSSLASNRHHIPEKKIPV
jgi:hypothetical protein